MLPLETQNNVGSRFVETLFQRIGIKNVRQFISLVKEECPSVQKQIFYNDEQILSQDEKNSSVFIFFGGNGHIAVYTNLIVEGQLQRILLNDLSLPNIVGEMSLVTNGVITADIVIKGRVTAAKIEINEFYDRVKCLKLDDELLNLIHNRFEGKIAESERMESEEIMDKIQKILPTLQFSFYRDVLEQIAATVRRNKYIFYRKHFEKGSFIFKQTREAEIPQGECSVYILTKGCVGVYKRSSEGEPIFFHHLQKGALLGEMALLTGERFHKVEIATHENCEVIEIKEEDFKKILNSSPKLRCLLEELSEQHLPKESEFSGFEKASQKVEAIPLKERKKLIYKVLERNERGILTLNPEIKLQFIEINRSNAQKQLGKLIVHEEIDGISRLQLRQECLYRDPSISTSRAYTRNILPVTRASSLAVVQKEKYKKELFGENRWIEERARFHFELKSKWKEKLKKSHFFLQEKLGEILPKHSSQSLLLILSGNTGVGKSYLIKHLSLIDQRLANLDIPHISILSTDAIRADIRFQEGFDEKGNLKINSKQSQSEAAWITESLIEWAITEKLSFVIDKRFLTLKEVKEIAQPAKKKGNYIVMLDVDAELQTSFDRVFGNFAKKIQGRDPNGPDPIPSRNLIENDYSKAVLNRYAKSQMAEIDEYYLFKNDATETDPLLFKIAHRTSSKEPLVISDRYRHLFYHITRDPQWDLLVSCFLHTILRMSRTSKGKIDTSATENKIFSIAVQGSSASKYADQNLQGVLEHLFTRKDIKFATPEHLKRFIEQTARDVNRGILKMEAPLYRNSDSTKYPYTRIEDLPQAFSSFVKEFYMRLRNPNQDPVDLAAWVEYKVDLTDHFFQDGCGRVSKVLSAWILVRFYGHRTPVPKYRGREEYYGKSPKRREQKYREEYFSQWRGYYRSLFDFEGRQK